MFITPAEFDRLVARIVADLDLRMISDDRYVYVTHDAQVDPARTERCIWLQRPQTVAQTLYLVQHGLGESPADVARLFDRARRRWRPFVSRPVRATNIVHGGSHSYRDLAFTSGALALYESGWAWRQEGVANVAYEPDATAAAPAPMSTE